MIDLRRFLAIIILTLLASTAAGSAAAAGGQAAFGLRPVRSNPAHPETQAYFIYDAAFGTTVNDEVLVRNTGTAAGTVRLYAVDGLTSDTSGSSFGVESAPRTGVGAWLRLAEPQLTLGPGEERVVAFSVTIPPDAAVGQHLGGLVAQAAEASTSTSAAGMQITTQTRAVTAVQVNLPGASVEQISVTGITPGGQNASQVLALGLRNDGTAMVKPQGTLSVTDAQGQEVQHLPLKLDTFLPGSAIQYPVVVQKQALGAGQYHAKVTLTYGTSGVTSYEGDFSITAAQVAQVFPSAEPALAPPPVAAASAAPATTITTAPAQWPLFAGGAVLLGIALAGGIILGRRGRAGGAAK